MILLIDNYDSFTYNVKHYLNEVGAEVETYRNDAISIEDIIKLQPKAIVLSPGPCTPNEAGISVDCIKHFAGRVPILGVCLGHQSIGQAFGARIIRAPELMHGKTDQINHDNQGLFKGIENPFVATRYHSLVIKPTTLPKELTVSAWTDTGGERQIMGVRHTEFPLEGWQFHPESFLTEPGIELLKRFLNW